MNSAKPFWKSSCGLVMSFATGSKGLNSFSLNPGSGSSVPPGFIGSGVGTAPGS